jgi:clan AA aspartic protease
MPHESGSVNASDEAWMRIRFVSGETHECLIDTGFSGALYLPRTLVNNLGLPIIGREPVGSVNDREEDMDISLAEINWLEVEQKVHVIVGEANDSLIGTELLKGTRLSIDYINCIVSIAIP